VTSGFGILPLNWLRGLRSRRSGTAEGTERVKIRKGIYGPNRNVVHRGSIEKDLQIFLIVIPKA